MRCAVVELRPFQYAAATCYFWVFLVFACMVQHADTGPVLAKLAKSAETLWSRAYRMLSPLADVDDVHPALGRTNYLLVRWR